MIINRGQTRADGRATVKIDGGTSEALTALLEGLVTPVGQRELASSLER